MMTAFTRHPFYACKLADYAWYPFFLTKDEHKDEHKTTFLYIGIYTHLRNQPQQRESNSEAHNRQSPKHGIFFHPHLTGN